MNESKGTLFCDVLSSRLLTTCAVVFLAVSQLSCSGPGISGSTFNDSDRPFPGTSFGFFDSGTQNRYYAQAVNDLKDWLRELNFVVCSQPEILISDNYAECFVGTHANTRLYITVWGTDYSISGRVNFRYYEQPTPEQSQVKIDAREFRHQMEEWWEKWKLENVVTIESGDNSFYPERLRRIKLTEKLSGSLSAINEFQNVCADYVYPDRPDFGYLKLTGDVSTRHVWDQLVKYS